MNECFFVIVAVVIGNEIFKELFVNLKVDEFIINVLKGLNKISIFSVYDVIRILLIFDDNRVVVL